MEKEPARLNWLFLMGENEKLERNKYSYCDAFHIKKRKPYISNRFSAI
jgi:hypothetical protein